MEKEHVMRRISTSHLIFLVLISACAVFLNWSAITASPTLFNLIIIAPSGALVLILALYILYITIKTPTEVTSDAATKLAAKKALIGDVILLATFAIFCLSLTTVGFDVATFLFVWLGIVLGGERNWFIPPIFAAIFTFALTKGFGSLFPFPMPLMVF